MIVTDHLTWGLGYWINAVGILCGKLNITQHLPFWLCQRAVMWHKYFTLLCSRHHHHLQNLFIILNWTLYPLNNISSSPPSVQPLAATILLPVCMNLTTLRRITPYLSFCAWLTSLSIMSLSFIQLVACVKCFLFYGWIIVHCMDIPPFGYSSIHWWTFGFFFAFWWLWIKLLWTCVYRYVWVRSLEYITRSRIAG